MAVVDVRPTPTASDQLEFGVRVDETGSQSSHEVTVSRDDFDRLSRPGEDPADFVARCFNFLLEREPKESIMTTFDIGVIGRYFPEFESVINP